MAFLAKLNSGMSDDPNGPNDPGPLERKVINPIRSYLGLATRKHYTGALLNGEVQIWFRTVAGKEKVLKWSDAQVGGKHVPR